MRFMELHFLNRDNGVMRQTMQKINIEDKIGKFNIIKSNPNQRFFVLY